MTESSEDRAPRSSSENRIAETSGEGSKAPEAPESPKDTSAAAPAPVDATADSEAAKGIETTAESSATAESGATAAAETTAESSETAESGATAAAETTAESSATAESGATAGAETTAESETSGVPPAPVLAPEPEPEPLPRPCVAAVEPACVASYGGAVIKVMGADFAPGCSLRLGGQEVASHRASAARIEAVVPQLPAGNVDVEVVNPDGQSDRLEGALELAVPPAVGEVVPSTGSVNGGTEIVLTGFGFEPGCTVTLGAVAVAVAHESAQQLRFVSPPHLGEGSVALAVRNPTGLEHRLPGAFFYKTPPPRIDTVSPGEGSNAGGTRLTVRGADFSEGCEILICGLPVSVDFKSTEELVVTTPAVPRDGLVDLRIQNRDGQVYLAQKVFQYMAPLPPPLLHTVSPVSGPQSGGLKVGLFGDDFHPECFASFGGVKAQVRFLTRKQLEVVVPASTTSGPVSVEVRHPDGGAVVLEAAFTYESKPAPTITSVSPGFGPCVGGTKLVIEGTNFTKESVVYIGREYPKDLVVKSATEIHVLTAARKASGVVDVEVSLPDAPKAVLKNGFRYDATPAPTITSVSPNRGGTAGGSEITVTGQNLLKETVILVDGKPAKYVKLIDKTTLEGKTPPGEANKMVDVAVRNPDGKEAVQKRAYLYDPRYG